MTTQPDRSAPREPSPGAMPRVPAMLVMHSDLAAAMVRAAEKVYGPVEGLEVVSNDGMSRDALQSDICRRAKQWPDGGLVLTDFWGGSCHTCGASAAREQDLIVLTGCNVSILLDYLHNRDTYTKEALAERLQRKGQESIRLQRGHQA